MTNRWTPASLQIRDRITRPQSCRFVTLPNAPAITPHAQAPETAKVAELKHTTLAIARLRFLFLAAKVWRDAGRVGVNYSDQYAERGLFQRLMHRLRTIAPGEANFLPVLVTPLRS